MHYLWVWRSTRRAQTDAGAESLRVVPTECSTHGALIGVYVHSRYSDIIAVIIIAALVRSRHLFLRLFRLFRRYGTMVRLVFTRFHPPQI